MGRAVCSYRGCGQLTAPADKMGREFGLCPRHARAAKFVLGITTTTTTEETR